MKKLIAAIICSLFMLSPAMANDFSYKLLDGVAATGASAKSFTIHDEDIPNMHTVAVYYTDANASISALVVTLEGSTDRPDVADGSAHWFTLGTLTFSGAQLTAKQGMMHVVNKPVPRVRLNITTLTGEGAGDLIYGLYTYGR